ncbi:hypothetical protein GALL_433830 [mine drainage metagenome]|uniref:Uncharacterized protein n=1 Tax=mine drainage metagenome TaxID=410659 RepID=A0A1J5PV14_9ZZZZ
MVGVLVVVAVEAFVASFFVAFVVAFFGALVGEAGVVVLAGVVVEAGAWLGALWLLGVVDAGWLAAVAPSAVGGRESNEPWLGEVGT